jgi:Asp-tRNA(Asn)/Glu-tRNA(Gln) amidotransferase A subunit family amidase
MSTGLMSEIHRLSATDIARRINAGELTAEAVTSACLARITEREPLIHAWCNLEPEVALREARSCDAGTGQGLLRGVPVGVKDIIDTADFATQHGSPIYRDNRPLADASCVALTRAAGGIVLGKTVTTEFANRHPGPTVNPHAPGHTPGGSSSGSAAAVADFQVPVAFGTQTAGSVIRPAAYCGVIGYKPTFGHFSPAGIKLQSHSLDTLGVLCRSLDDVALMRSVLLGGEFRPLDKSSGAPRIALCRTPAWSEADDATQALMERTAAHLARAGAVVTELTFPACFNPILEVHGRIMDFEAARNYAFEYRTRAAELSPELLDGVLFRGASLSADSYFEALEVKETYQAFIVDQFAELDAILAPSAPGEAPEGLAWTGDPRFNSLWTLAATPCLNLPCGEGPRRLPLGIQLIGARGRDAALLDLAAWVQSRLDGNSYSSRAARP